MGATRPSQRPTAAVLAAVAAAMLLLAGQWWVSHAPASSSDIAIAPPTPIGLAGRQPLVRDAIVDFEVQAESITEVVPVPPHHSEILTFDLADVERLLPDPDDLLRRRSAVLTSDTVLDYSGPVPGGQQVRLEFACRGAGGLVIEVSAPDTSPVHHRHPCDGTVGAIEFAAARTGLANVRLRASTVRLVGVAVQLVRR